MVLNFTHEGAAINVFAKQNDINISIIDAGVKGQFNDDARQKIKDLKIAEGTRSFLHGPAMTTEQCQKAIQAGAEMVNERFNDGCNIIGFGEMGIGNTSSSAMLMHLITGESLETCVGKGTGLDEAGISNKREILESSLKHYQQNGSPMDLLAHFGGFELAMIVGGFLQAASNKMTILVDGFNVTAALLVAQKIEPNVLEYCIFAHQSDEKGHLKMLEYLNAKPLLNIGMRLGEGTGAAVAYPLIKASVNFLNKMASFDEAGVSNKE
jgi:nicotinate-nucleotide--dimethylbenzimidazole phosphoribosyltransferase